MNERSGFDRQRQRAALTALQRRAGRPATEIATLLGLSYPQYNRYLWGQAALRVDQVGPFARAYGVAPSVLASALGLGEDDPDAASETGWSLDEARAYLEAAGLPLALVAERMDVLRALAPLSRRGAAEAFALIWARHRGGGGGGGSSGDDPPPALAMQLTGAC